MNNSEYLAECQRLWQDVLYAYDAPWHDRERRVRIATKAYVDHVNTRTHGCTLCGATDLQVGVPHKCKPVEEKR